MTTTRVFNALLADMEPNIKRYAREGVDAADEECWWNVAATKAEGSRERSRAIAFRDALGPLRISTDGIGDADVCALKRLVRNVVEALDELWRARPPADLEPYPEARMRDLMLGISCVLNDRVATLVAGMCHMASERPSRPLLLNALGVLDEWTTIVSRLTTVEWPAYRDNIWIGTPPLDICTVRLRARIFALYEGARFNFEMMQLAAADESVRGLIAAATAKDGHVFAAMWRLGASAPMLLTANEAQWDEGRAALDAWLSCHAETVAAALCARLLIFAGAAPEIAGREAACFAYLLSRPQLSKRLQPEREALLECLRAGIAFVALEIRAIDGCGTRTPATCNRKGIVAAVHWWRAARMRIRSLHDLGTMLVGNLPSFMAFSDYCAEHEQRAARAEMEVFATWAAEAEEALHPGGQLDLQRSGRVIEFDVRGDVVVCFPGALIALFTDARALRESGLAIPAAVLAAAETGERALRAAAVMRGAAAFYNALGADIVPCTKLMLLRSLTAFELVVASLVPTSRSDGKSSGVLTWTESRRCAEFADTLSRAAHRVAVDNRSIRDAHSRMLEATTVLMQL